MKFQLKTKQQLIDYLRNFNPKKYASSRNFINGQVSHLSPYITHGVITIQECCAIILEKYTIKEAEKFLMELIWKEFFVQVQINYGNILTQEPIWEDKTWIQKSETLPSSIASWDTKTWRVDATIEEMITTGWLHNHKRMWFASRCCHWAKLDWKKLADWTYYHFIDWELSSNHLSWQWVNSTFANKAYFMNEWNLQKYRPGTSDQNLRGTYEEVSARLFNPQRPSNYRKQEDMYSTLTTPTDLLTPYHEDQLWTWWKVRILSPRRLDKEVFSDDTPTIILLDKEFTTLHPWSAQRIEWVQSYAKKYTIPFVVGSYDQAIQDALERWKSVVLDQRYDPIYRETVEKYNSHDDVSILRYPRVWKDNQWQPIMKFFKYWNKASKVLKKSERQQSLFAW